MLKVIARRFQLDGVGAFDGFTACDQWNGFECPMFDVETAKRIGSAFVRADARNVVEFNDRGPTMKMTLDATGDTLELGEIEIRVGDDLLRLIDFSGAGLAWTKAQPAILLNVVCPSCAFGLNVLDEMGVGVEPDDVPTTQPVDVAGYYKCDSCGFVFDIRVDDLRDAQHRLLVALGEA
jgi:hypothetical protein